MGEGLFPEQHQLRLRRPSGANEQTKKLFHVRCFKKLNLKNITTIKVISAR